MLAGLRHHALIGSDCQHYQVDTACAGEHVFDKALVPWHIHESEMSIADGRFGEPEIYGNAALFFLGKTIRVNAGQRLDECGLAVIDVPCGADNYFHNKPE